MRFARTTWGLPVLITAAVLVAVGALDYGRQKPGAQVPSAPGVIVLSPAEGEVVASGGLIHVIVEPEAGVQLDDVVVAGPGILERSNVGPPFDLMVQLPANFAGQLVLGVSGLVSGGGGSVGLRLTLNVEPDGSLVATNVDVVPADVRLRVGAETEVGGVASFVGGGEVTITSSRDAAWSVADPRVARLVDMGGGLKAVEGLDFGQTQVTVDYRGLRGSAEVRVEGGDVRGDLNGDGFVNKLDEDILLGAFGRRANPEDPRDLNSDGVIDQLDLEVFKGLMCGSVLNPGMVPGGGSATSDCLGEWSLPDGALLDSKKCVPSGKQWCVDGAPCDADGQKDGVCSFALRVALNAQDAQLPDCSPSSLETYSVLKPSAADALKRPEDLANRTALTNALAALGSPPLSGSTYTEEVQLRVPFKVTTKGLTKGKKKIKVLFEGPGGIKDTDKLKLTCYPAPVV